MLCASSAAAWSCGLAQGSTLISVGLGFLVQTYTHVKKSHACMQTNGQKHKDTYKHRRNGEDGGDESAGESQERRRDKRSGMEGGPE